MTIVSVIVTLLIFSLIVVVHEYGHFIAARKNGILVEEFAVGMGPILLSRKKGDTLYSIRAFPLGGFCKMLGEEDGDTSDSRSFSSKTVWQRIVVCLAGVVMNFLLAVVLGCILISITGISSTVVKEVFDGYPAQTAGLMPGDKIIKINGKNVLVYEYIGLYLRAGDGNTVEVTFERAGDKITVPITPYAVPLEGGYVNYYIGVGVERKAGFFASEKSDFQTVGLAEMVKGAFGKSVFYVSATFDSLSQLFRQKVKVDDLRGPIGMGQIVDMGLQAAVEQKESQVISFLSFVIDMAMLLSANLAVMNLLPIPAIDGGRIVFLIIEGVRRRPVDPDKEGLVHLIGFALVIGLAIFVAFNDIRRIF